MIVYLCDESDVAVPPQCDSTDCIDTAKHMHMNVVYVGMNVRV